MNYKNLVLLGAAFTFSLFCMEAESELKRQRKNEEEGVGNIFEYSNEITPEETLVLACENDDLPKVQALIQEHGLDPSQKYGEVGALIHIAARHGSLDVFKYLIEECKISLFQKNDKGEGVYKCAFSGLAQMRCLSEVSSIMSFALPLKSFALPFKYSKPEGCEAIIKYIKMQREHQECPVCLEAITEVMIDGNNIEFACKECYALICKSCKKEWAQRGGTCPQCRQPMARMEEDMMIKVTFDESLKKK